MSDKEKYRETIEEGTKKVTREDMGVVLSKADELLELVSRVKVLKKFASQAALLLRLISDYSRGRYDSVPWRTIAMGVFALLYVINPMDLIPDYIPVIGYVDDSAVFGAVWAAIRSDVKDYALYVCGEGRADERFESLVRDAFGRECKEVGERNYLDEEGNE